MVKLNTDTSTVSHCKLDTTDTLLVDVSSRESCRPDMTRIYMSAQVWIYVLAQD